MLHHLVVILLCTLPLHVSGRKYVIDHWDDQYAECAAWADNFQCEKNPKFMLRKCIESCYLHDTVHGAVLSGKYSMVTCESSVGPFILELHPLWAPWGVNRFLKLVSDGYFNNSPLNRSHYFINFGNTPDMDLLAKWNSIPPIPDDLSHLKPLAGGAGFKQGMVSFSSKPSNGRSTNLFILLADDETLGLKSWESPIGQVVDGLSNLKKLHSLAYYQGKDESPLPMITSCTAELPLEEKSEAQADFDIVSQAGITNRADATSFTRKAHGADSNNNMDNAAASALSTSTNHANNVQSNKQVSASTTAPISGSGPETLAKPNTSPAAVLAAQARIERRRRIRIAERVKERQQQQQQQQQV